MRRAPLPHHYASLKRTQALAPPPVLQTPQVTFHSHAASPSLHQPPPPAHFGGHPRHAASWQPAPGGAPHGSPPLAGGGLGGVGGAAAAQAPDAAFNKLGIVLRHLTSHLPTHSMGAILELVHCISGVSAAGAGPHARCLRR